MDNLTAGNPRAHAVRVYFENSGSATIYEGMPLCYNFDTTDNWFGGSVSDAGVVSATGTTAEGSQNEGKYIRTELPSTTNLQWFAGVVKKGGWVGKSDARAVDIYVPNGAIVPCRVDFDTTAAGRSIVCLEDSSAALTYLYSANYTARPVGVAAEDVSSTGLCLCKLDPNMFICQDLSTSSALIIAPSGSASCALNRINVTNAATSGEMCAFEVKMEATGGVNSPWGLAGYFRSKVSAAITDRTCSVGVIMSMESGSSAAQDLLSALRAKLVANTGSTISSCQNANVLDLEADLDVTAPARCSWIHCASIGTNAPNFFIDALDAGDLSDATVSTADITSQDNASDRNIPIRLGNTTYYIRAFVTA